MCVYAHVCVVIFAYWKNNIVNLCTISNCCIILLSLILFMSDCCVDWGNVLSMVCLCAFSVFNENIEHFSVWGTCYLQLGPGH